MIGRDVDILKYRDDKYHLKSSLKLHFTDKNRAH